MAKKGTKVKIVNYRPQPGDPPALKKPCPICPARVGEWCGGFGDIHSERV